MLIEWCFALVPVRPPQHEVLQRAVDFDGQKEKMRREQGIDMYLSWIVYPLLSLQAGRTSHF